LFNLGHGGDKTIPSPGDGLDEARLFGIVLQYLADLADGAVDAVVGIEKGALAPDTLDNLLARNDLSPLLDKKEQNLEWNPLQLEHTTGATEFIGLGIEFDIIPKPDRILVSNELRGQRNSPARRVAVTTCARLATASTSLGLVIKSEGGTAKHVLGILPYFRRIAASSLYSIDCGDMKIKEATYMPLLRS
jgi:hypothetical protein